MRRKKKMSVTARGGYQIADFKGLSIPINETSAITDVVNIPGIYAAFSGLKPIQYENLVVAGSDDPLYPAYIIPEYDVNQQWYNFHIKIESEGITLAISVKSNDDVGASIAPQG